MVISNLVAKHHQSLWYGFFLQQRKLHFLLAKLENPNLFEIKYVPSLYMLPLTYFLSKQTSQTPSFHIPLLTGCKLPLHLKVGVTVLFHFVYKHLQFRMFFSIGTQQYMKGFSIAQSPATWRKRNQWMTNGMNYANRCLLRTFFTFFNYYTSLVIHISWYLYPLA